MNKKLNDFTIPSKIKDIIQKAYPDRELMTFTQKVSSYASWYKGFVEDFHNYRVFTSPDHSIEMERKSLKMAKYVCESWASLLLNEKCDIVVEDKELLDKVLQDCNFWQKANVGVEKSFALGFGALVVGVRDLMVGETTKIVKTTDKTKVTMTFVEATRVVPLSIDDGEIVECAFFTQTDNKFILVAHVRNEQENYLIHTFELDKKTNKLIGENIFDTQSPLKWFEIIKPNIVDNDIFNNSDFEFISIFANATDILKSIDIKYDAFDLEYALGKKKMIISEDVTNYSRDKDGNVVKSFDPNNVLYYRVPTGSSISADAPNPILQTFDPVLRHDAFIRGIHADMNYLSMKCGLGDNFFKFDGSNISTATQVISENSTLFRNVKKHEIFLEQVLTNLARAIMYASNEFTKNKFPKWENEEIKILFDDSIIEDKNAEITRDQTLVNAGLMGKVEFRMKWFGETEEVAQENILKFLLPETIQRYMPIMASGLLTPEKFVGFVFPKEVNKEALIEYITESIQRSPQLDMDNLYQGDESGGNSTDEDVDEDE